MSKFLCLKATTTLFLNLLITIVLLSGCKSRPYVYFSASLDSKNLHKEKEGVVVRLQLSSENSIDNTLKIINNRKNSITIMPNKLNLKLKYKGITVPINARYYRLVNKRKKRAYALCNKAGPSYSCIDRVSDFYTDRNLKGFKFGTVDSRSHVEGYVAFNLPDALCGKEVVNRYNDIFETDIRDIDGVIDIEVDTRRGPVSFEFPVHLEVYYDIDNVPYSRKNY